jgi:hypothetical protein
MPDEKKDVARKLEFITKAIIKAIKDVKGESGTEGEQTRERLGVGSKSENGHHEGLRALVALFDRQIRAQYEAHKLSDTQFFPIKEGEEIAWDSPWMRYMTMWLDAMIDETEETRNWLNWKCWKKPVNITQNVIENARFELIDLLHFWINAYFMLGGTPESLVVEYHAKRDENDDRQKRGY